MYFTVPYDKILTKQERKTPLCRGSAEIQEMDTVKNFFEKLRKTGFDGDVIIELYRWGFEEERALTDSLAYLKRFCPEADA